MLFIESFLRRAELAEIVSRWMVNQPHAGDVIALKRIVNFNSYISHIWLEELALTLLRGLYPERRINQFTARSKADLKDFIVDHPQYVTPRIETLIQHYHKFPQDFYRETPFEGTIYYVDGDNPLYIGSTRIKRFRRIAEKGSRRIVEYLFDRIRQNADVLAEERARRLGIPKNQLITPLEEQVEEFLHGERRLIKGLQQGTVQHELPLLNIPDVVGIKIITEGDQYQQLLKLIESDPNHFLIEEEHHSGRYNATNLRVAQILDRDKLKLQIPKGKHVEILSRRGFDPDTIERHYHEFLDVVDRQVMFEIIACNYEECLESEVGRSMHEERILQQRTAQNYHAHVATNVRYLMDYIFALCLCPQKHDIDDVPVKLWVKYMPDTIDALLRGIFGISVSSLFIDPP